VDAFNDEDIKTFKVDVFSLFIVGLVFFCVVLAGMLGVVTDNGNY
jgi:hypothetical protein